ncbi:Glycosyltransferase involved in cell wall bisynthesis [Chitinophaga terrae (ex Kim and Jung 2007)]|jgi:glycosyltransferase involved in cell wall biosynthesis|uniref:Glycosyltransferase involved in cell wall bisynthesis n=1 Tax=Chitinophaga terrae (ex Kim and Jung 2007) TaxID=408074 RepID=A0A1H3ZA48_9BACT|nr:glycosyltransferase family 2 protein [Chitinophaga terrae (ex Kim and Jung 2007)]MDQ0109252.1 glycosyltransferase involved in cell wall biosynthesis [Chitinophaga terrae (ex Kim and Jung 2007)]GEP88650.1 glycosyl transferase family 2 [Chitinophaga terrae (ex Kim and Jung 2007)]SEA20673.1 Glycosyltransferase involved in cell wall bisynthesis [Chitinophaga terrae (ex Kim and Jung 2007)]
MNISVIVPLKNEEESLPELAAWIERVMDTHRFTYEVWMVDDGSTDDSWNVILQLAAQNPNIKGIKFQRNYGKSAALNEGFNAAQGDVVITMDADLQDSPDEIPELYRMIVEDGYDLVSGWKKKRYDNALTKNLPSKLYNYTTTRMSGVKLHDMNCGLKAYRKKVIKSIEVYGEMHRYIPVIAKWNGFRKIGEKVVEHRPRKYGVSKFGLERFINGFLDLATIMFIGKFGKRPMHLFGALGVLSFFVGFVIAAYLAIAKILFDKVNMTDRPLFYLGLLCMIIGSQLFLTGFIGELVTRNAPERNAYLVEERMDLTNETVNYKSKVH